MPKLFHLSQAEPSATSSPPLDDRQQLCAAVAGDVLSEGAKVPVEQLWCIKDQVNAIEDMYQSKTEFRVSYDDGAESQESAHRLLKDHHLSSKALEQLESRWMKVWSSRWPSKQSWTIRILVQCTCGYSTSARQTAGQKKPTKKQKQEWARCAPYDFTGCLAHADITYDSLTGRIRRVIGILEHNEACRASVMKRMPPVPLHPHVFEVALQQLQEGATITSIQTRNVVLCKRQAYRDQTMTDPTSANHRYTLQPSDFSRLYVHHHRSHGIDVKQRAEVNIDEWLNESSVNFKPDIASAIFHYNRRAEEGDRFKVFISTSDMEVAAWACVHGSQLILDGTFGVSSSRLLLWIAMGLDPKGKGLPVALFLFSAPSGTIATHAGYDTPILSHLLQTWKTWLSSRPAARSRVFEPAVVITDTDVKERGALITTWPSVTLLLCKFHLRQCWTNKRSLVLRNSKDSSWGGHVLTRIRQLETVLLQSTEYSHALSLIEEERQYLQNLQGDAASKPTADGGLAFLSYLSKYWMPEDLWKSWSQLGRIQAASRLGIPVEGVLPTTNHLESFNGVFKNKYLPQWQHSRRRLRFDVLILHLIRHIIPHIYALVRQRNEAASWRASRFAAAAGGAALPGARTGTGLASGTPRPFAWFADDSNREKSALAIIRSHRVRSIPSLNESELWATCATSASSDSGSVQPHERYWITIHTRGAATCTCADWLQRGGACKHLRAFKYLILHWTLTGQLRWTGHFPSSLKEAIEIYTTTSEQSDSDDAPTGPLCFSDYPRGYAGTTPPPNMQPPHSAADSIHEARLMEAPSLLAAELQLSDLAHLADDPELVSDEFAGDDGTFACDLSGGGNDATGAGYWELNQGSNQHAIEIQLEQRIRFDIKTLAPRLHGLLHNVSDISTLGETDLEMENFLDLLDNLRAIIGTKVLAKRRVDEVEDHSTRSKKHRADGPDARVSTSIQPILPPSPEVKQIRKKSHKTF